MELIGKATFVGNDDILYYDAESFLDCIRDVSLKSCSVW